jgi:catalase
LLITCFKAAFSPSHVIPYFEYSIDPVLQSRLFSYPDTHRHRLGVNYQQLPVNAPICPVANFQRDGPAAFVSQGSRPNYQSTIQPLKYLGRKGTLEGGVRDRERADKHEKFLGGAWRDLSEITECEPAIQSHISLRF